MFDQLDTLRLSATLAQIQHSMHYRARPAVAELLVNSMNGLLPQSMRGAPADAYDARLHMLKNRGIARLGRVLERDQVEALTDYFKSRPCYAGHVAGKSDGVGRSVDDCAARSHYGSYRSEDIYRAPFLPELANREDILTLAEGYLGCVPTIYAVNAFWSFPDQSRPWPGIQTFHRDFDDFRFCTLFLFLTDITAEDGAHFYIPGSHRLDVMDKVFTERSAAWQREFNGQAPPFDYDALFAENADLNEACARLFPGAVETVTAQAGDAVIEDTYGLHKGDIPKSRRLVVWMRYGLYKNLTNQRDNVVPLPAGALAGRIADTPRHKFINRLLVQP